MEASRRKQPGRILTLSNGLTSTRLLAAPCFYWAIVNHFWVFACVLFWLAVMSDVIDGRLARSRGETSAFGGFLDHGSDAAFVTLGHAAMTISGTTPWPLPFLIATAFLQYVVDSRLLSGHPLRASWIGRWNGICYFIAPGVLVTREAIGLGIPADDWLEIFGWLLVISTLISMGNRLIGIVFATQRDLTDD